MVEAEIFARCVVQVRTYGFGYTEGFTGLPRVLGYPEWHFLRPSHRTRSNGNRWSTVNAGVHVLSTKHMTPDDMGREKHIEMP